MVVKAWIQVLIGFMTLGLIYAVTAPVFDVLYAMCDAMGGNVAYVAEMVQYIMTYAVPTLIALSLLIYGVVSSTKEENNSRWR